MAASSRSSNVSFQLDRSTVVGLIGPNGSGKTTLLNVINGVVPADAGTIRLGDADIGGQAPEPSSPPSG